MQKKRKNARPMILNLALYLLIGIWCGIYSAEAGLLVGTFSEQAADILYFLLCLYAAMFLQLIFHEAGHLVFGLMTGYRFSSFRIGNFIWIRQGDRIRFGRYSLAGTAGQCLICPPDIEDGTFPVVLYNLGGVIQNAALGLVFLELHLVTRGSAYLSLFFQMLSALGFMMALVNEIGRASCRERVCQLV